MSFQVTITRATGSFATSFDLWAKLGSSPENDGEGVYVANVPIRASATSVTYVPTIALASSYKYIAIPLYLDQVGLPGKMS